MNYHHLYHAGNFTDVFKHTILVLLIRALERKDKPFCYLDTHAGIGRYDLFSEEAQKTQEFENGIITLLKGTIFPEEVIDYLSVIRIVNANVESTRLKFYPGSPVIVRQLLRPQDRMILTELHPQEMQLLKQEFLRDQQTSVHHLDGYQALKAFLPPKERRGLVLIDPPFEQVNEFEQITTALITAYKQWPTGIYAVWYPLKKMDQVKEFYNTLQKSILEKILMTEFAIYPLETPQGLNGCGMVIINPPYQIDEQLAKLIPWLWQALSPAKKGYFRLEFLK